MSMINKFIKSKNKTDRSVVMRTENITCEGNRPKEFSSNALNRITRRSSRWIPKNYSMFLYVADNHTIKYFEWSDQIKLPCTTYNIPKDFQ